MRLYYCESVLETGLLEETKVLVETRDSGAEAISTGVFGAGDILIQLGSSCYIVYISDEKFEEKKLWQGKFIIPDTYCILAGTNAGILIKWFKDNIYSYKESNKGSDPFTRMSEEITDISPGRDGLITLPYFARERTPINDPETKGVVFGLKLNHTKNHMYKSSLEGIAYSIDQILEILKNINYQ